MQTRVVSVAVEREPPTLCDPPEDQLVRAVGLKVVSASR